ncbi:MAG: hypothetical protein K6B41_04205, partial [Butyrivibrio sp.]|nr:hypothetical protein [Butyrivibrio sp.]
DLYSQIDSLSRSKYVVAHNELKTYLEGQKLVVKEGEITDDYKYKEDYDRIYEATEPGEYYEKGDMKVGIYYTFPKLKALIKPEFVYPVGTDYNALGKDLEPISDLCRKFLTLNNMDLGGYDLDDDFDSMYLKQDLIRTIMYKIDKVYQKYGLDNAYMAYQDQIALNEVQNGENQNNND